MIRFLQLQALLGFAVGVLAMGCRHPSEPDAQVNVQVQAANQASDTIGAEGGSITAIGDDDTVYQLTLPPGAIDEATPISVAPVDSIRTAPFSDGVRGAFHLEPSGLVFGATPTMTVTHPAGTDPGQLRPFLYGGDGEDLHLEPAIVDGQDVSFAIAHFSGGGGGRGRGTPAPDSEEGIARQAIFDHMNAQLLAGEPLDTAFLTGVLAEWYQSSIKPGLSRVGDAPSSYAVRRLPPVYGEWRAWRVYVESGPFSTSEVATVSTNLGPELDEARGLAARGIRAVFEVANAESAVSESLERVQVALWWAKHAALFDVEDLENLGIEQLRQELACELVVQSETFPDPLSTGTPGNLDVTVGYRFDGGATHFTNVVGTYRSSGTVETNVSPVTSGADGRLQRTFTRASDQTDVTIDVTISFEDPLLRTVSLGDLDRPILYTALTVVRGGSGGTGTGGTLTFWEDTDAQGAFREFPGATPLAVVEHDAYGGVVTGRTAFLQPSFSPDAASGWRINVFLNLTCYGCVGYEGYPGRQLLLMAAEPDGSFYTGVPEWGRSGSVDDYTVQPGDGRFTLHHLTRGDGSKYTAVSVDLMFSPSTDYAVGAGWEIHEVQRYVREGWDPLE